MQHPVLAQNSSKSESSDDVSVRSFSNVPQIPVDLRELTEIVERFLPDLVGNQVMEAIQKSLELNDKRVDEWFAKIDHGIQQRLTSYTTTINQQFQERDTDLKTWMKAKLDGIVETIQLGEASVQNILRAILCFICGNDSTTLQQLDDFA